MRDGDIYVGVTSKPNTLPVMKKLDSKRYAELTWANPREATLPAEKLGNMPGASSPDTEDGLFWDMLTDLAVIMRDPMRTPMQGLVDPKIFLTGWSQSGAYMVRYVNDFAYRETREQPLFDGYLAGGTACIAYPGLNQEEPPSLGAEDPDAPWRLGKHFQPYIDVHTESENMDFGTKEARHPDSDDEDFPYRAYDIPGASHDTHSTMIGYYYMDPDLFATGLFPAYGGQEPLANDCPYEFSFNASYQMLFDWVNNGVIPQHIPLIEIDDASSDSVRDMHGNVVGGWRSAFVDCPTCTYFKASTPLTPAFDFGCKLFGYKVLFGTKKMKELYGTLDNFTKQVEEMAERQVNAKQLLPGDQEAYIKLAVEMAKQAGL